MRILLTIILTAITSIVLAQETNYSHCNCKEVLTKEEYKLISDGVEMEIGQFANGLRNGLWISRNIKGIVIRKANYVNGQLDGKYSLYHFSGEPKLLAEFKLDQPVGQWTFLNEKGKVVKQGRYSEGTPVGIWKILDKKGKKPYVEYDFDSKTEIYSNGGQYFTKTGVIRDDQSGEYLILGFLQRIIQAEVQPLGGYMLAADLFADYLNVPTVFMDTYTQIENEISIEFSNGIPVNIRAAPYEKTPRFDNSKPSFPFLVDTNAPSKLSRISPSDASVIFLTNQIQEYAHLIGPWMAEKFDGVEKIRVPFVINEVKR